MREQPRCRSSPGAEAACCCYTTSPVCGGLRRRSPLQLSMFHAALLAHRAHSRGRTRTCSRRLDRSPS